MQDREPRGFQLSHQLIGGVIDRVVLAGRDEVNVVRRELAWPDDAELVVRVLHDRRNGPGNANAIRTHRDRDELAVLVEDLQAKRLRVLGAQLEDVAHLDAAGDGQRP